MTHTYIGLGANLGDRRANFAAALARLGSDLTVEAVSSLYETDPVGPQDQPQFLNACCLATTGLPARAVLDRLLAIERGLGRERRERWGPREIDLDLLLYGDAIIDEDGLRVPHAELANRAFVLVPLAEIAPDARDPRSGRTIAELADAIHRSGVALLEGQGWEKG